MSRQQRGVALITILIIVALVALIATGIASSLYLHLNRTSNVLDADQAREYARGAEAFAIQILKKSFEKDGDQVVHLKQMWAAKGMTFPLDDGVMTGDIRDMKACFNLNSLLSDAGVAPGGVNPNPGSGQPANPANVGRNGVALKPGQILFRNLVRELGLDTEVTADDLMEALTDWIDGDQNPAGPGGAEDAYYLGRPVPYRSADQLLANVSELRVVKGFTPEIVDALRPYVCALPDSDSIGINVNTLPKDKPELLMMLFKDNTLTAENARQFIDKRPEKGYKAAELSASPYLKLSDLQVPNTLLVKSDYFQIHARAIVGRGEANLDALVHKNGSEYRVLWRSFGEEQYDE